MPYAFLLSMQAAGMITDWLGISQQKQLSQMGEKVEQAGIDANITTSRLQTEEDTLASMKQLRQNLGTQAVAMAAKGERGPMGVIAMNESVGNFNADERIRRINQLSNENSLRANKIVSSLHEQTFESKLGNQFAKDFFNKIPTSPDAWNKLAGGGSGSSQGYGFTKV